MKPLVIYHANCSDGFGAAFAAWCKLGDDAEYLPMHYSDDPLKDVIYEGRDVYILDFSVPREDMERLLYLSSKVVWLDHHKTAFEMWCPGEYNMWMSDPMCKNRHIRLNNFKSGALLAWEYFHPEKGVPLLIRMIDDRDRWQFKFDDSKALHAGLQLEKPWTFERWAELVPAMGGSSGALAIVISNGYTALQVHKGLIDDAVKRSVRCGIPRPERLYESNGAGGFTKLPDTLPPHNRVTTYEQDGDSYKVLLLDGCAVNSSILQSEVGHELANASGTYGLVWYYDGATGRANCSLRSNGDYDVSAIAKVFGGGGHKNAAGFNIDMPTLLGWLK